MPSSAVVPEPSAGPAARRCSSGTPNPKVLPIPVRAWPMRSSPARASGSVSSWMAKVRSMPIVGESADDVRGGLRVRRTSGGTWVASSCCRESGRRGCVVFVVDGDLAQGSGLSSCSRRAHEKGPGRRYGQCRSPRFLLVFVRPTHVMCGARRRRESGARTVSSSGWEATGRGESRTEIVRPRTYSALILPGRFLPRPAPPRARASRR